VEPINPENLLNVGELAARLKVRPSWVYESCRTRGRRGKRPPLPVLRAGKYLLFDWTAVCSWLRAEQPSGSQLN
jgi:hypothetical protein